MFSIKFVLVIISFIIAFISLFIGSVKLIKAKRDFNKIDKLSYKKELFSYDIAFQNDNPKKYSKMEKLSKIILRLYALLCIVLGALLMSFYIMFEYNDNTFETVGVILVTIIMTIFFYFQKKLFYFRKEAFDSFFTEKESSSKTILEKRLDYSKKYLIGAIYLEISLIILTLIFLISTFS